MSKLTRRAVIAGTGAAALAACGTYGTPPASAPATSGGALAKTTDIEVGGGKVFGEQQVVVTQPEAGTFKAFTAVCTHQACTVASVSGGTINCECHGSKYKIADGSVANGPATKPLAAKSITVQGDSITLA